VRDYLGEKSVALIEWPEKGKGILPKADLIFKIAAISSEEREVELLAATDQGEKILNALLKD
jgi:tRNA threonylcarbamoyladenosine biosynthesis protein TsaE